MVYVVVGFCGHLLEETEINSSPNTSSHDLIPSDTAQCLSPSPKEVEAIFFRSLDWLCSPGTLSYTEFRMARYRNPFVISDQPAHSLTKVSPSSSSYPHYSDDYRYLIPAFGQTVQTLDWPRIWGITAMILNRVLLCLLPSSITLHYPPGIYSRLIPTSRPIGLPIDHTYQKT
ncbi:unnamed protein product [Protopolystoma xenopodis]|uniref:Uncharacterized protein n=1 Tax=Protopolystoma xenopodis TaxID=117903 RepID=A0A3S5AES5_9PLAT|nr:unnamed protein product [Protopolystoma xenopodis]